MSSSSVILAPGGCTASSVAACVQNFGLDASSTSIVAELGKWTGSPPTTVLVLAASPSARGAYSATLLAEVLSRLAPGGAAAYEVGETAFAEALRSALLLCGYTDITSAHGFLTARKPAWEAGASFSLRSRAVAAPAERARTWVLASEEDEELVEEADLLSEEELRKRAPVDDCEAGTVSRKPCANCTCGRADVKVTVGDTGADAANLPTSACGSCYLGDAFRCSTCPYLGTPAFKPGEKVSLASVGVMDL